MAYTAEQKEEYRRHKGLLSYDRRAAAQGLIKAAYKKAHPKTYKGARDGICSCGYPIDHGEIVLKLDENGHEYHSHKRCNSWACPVCAPKMASKRADEIEQALIGANKKGYQCYFLTFTVPHRKTHTTAYVLKKLDECYNKLLQSRKIRELKSEYSFVGQIKCKDYTIGENGTHAHLHCVWIFDIDEDPLTVARKLNNVILDKWDRLVFNETKRHINRHHGFNLEAIELGGSEAEDAEKIAHYAAKSISVYMSDGDKDKSSKTPFDLLNADATEEERAQYLDFYKGQKSKRHIVFSRGLKKLLEVKPKERPPANSAVIAYIGYENAYLLKDENKRQQFETIAAESAAYALEWLQIETVKQQRELKNTYLGMEFKDEYITPYAAMVRDWDERPSDRPQIIEHYRKEQEEDFPDMMTYADTWYAVHGDQLSRYLSIEEIEDIMARKMDIEYKKEQFRESERARELETRPTLPPIRIPQSYKKLETYEEREDWIAKHRKQYAEKCRERLRLNIAPDGTTYEARRHAAAQDKRAKLYENENKSINMFSESLFFDEIEEETRPKSGLGKFLEKAAISSNDF